MPTGFDTPVLFLIFNRPDITFKVFDQIRKIKPQHLFIAADGPRKEVKGEKERCDQTRAIVSQINWDCNLKTVFQPSNLGVAKAVSTAITWFFHQVEEGIILEDDCYPDETFFVYCRELLARYRHVDQVKLISGNNFQNGKTRGVASYYFSHYPEIWGWASWRRVWEDYDFLMHDVEDQLRSGVLEDAYASKSERNYWRRKFVQTHQGRTHTWDYQLTYSIIKCRGLAISPQVNLVQNIGISNNPSHFSLKDSAKDPGLHSITFPLHHPAEMMADVEADKYSFSRIYGKSVHRLLRILKENGIRTSLLYTLNKIFSK